MLTLPALRAECERVFSSAKLLITASRSRLYLDTIEANECPRAWFGKPKKCEEKVERGGQDSISGEAGGGNWGSGGESGKESDGEGGDGESDE